MEDEDLEELEDETLAETLEDYPETELTIDDTNTRAEQAHQDSFGPEIYSVRETTLKSILIYWSPNSKNCPITHPSTWVSSEIQ